jgi:hypothetical protein
MGREHYPLAGYESNMAQAPCRRRQRGGVYGQRRSEDRRSKRSMRAATIRYPLHPETRTAVSAVFTVRQAEGSGNIERWIAQFEQPDEAVF